MVLAVTPKCRPGSIKAHYDEDAFDPAAWQLKTIKLPSGGEIHVQYEQDDYTYVQDQPAHVMTSIDDIDERGKFYLNHLECRHCGWRYGIPTAFGQNDSATLRRTRS